MHLNAPINSVDMKSAVTEDMAARVCMCVCSFCRIFWARFLCAQHMHNVAWSVGSISPGQSAHLFVARSGCGLCKCRAVICDVCRVRGLRLWWSRLVRDGQLDALGTMIGIPHTFYNEIDTVKHIL